MCLPWFPDEVGVPSHKIRFIRYIEIEKKINSKNTFFENSSRYIQILETGQFLKANLARLQFGPFQPAMYPEIKSVKRDRPVPTR